MLPIIKTNFISQWKKELTTILFATVCVAGFIFFPAEGFFQELTRGLFFLFVLPVLYIKFILKKNIVDFGLNVKNYRAGLFWGTAMLLLSFIFFYLLINYTDFQNQRSLPAAVFGNFRLFLVYELFFVGSLFFLQEFFFKGFLLFTFAKKLEAFSIPLLITLYFLLFLATQDLNTKSSLLLILSLTGSITAYQSRSTVFSFLMGMLFMIIADAYLIHLSK